MLLLLLTMGTITFSCRCEQQTLDAYFERADIVTVGRVLRSRQIDAERVEVDIAYILRPDQPFKGSLEGITLATTTNSAACGVPVVPGRDYVFFAAKDPTSPGIARFDTCSGTRPYPTGLDDSPSFIGTPDNKVIERLGDLAAGKPASVAPPDANPWIGGLRTLKSAPANRPAAGEQAKLARTQLRSASYLDADWDGRVFLAAGGRRYRVSRLRSSGERPEYTVDLVERLRVRGIWWIRVDIYEVSPCTDPTAKPTHGGWIPAFSSRGRFVADSWPGGC